MTNDELIKLLEEGAEASSNLIYKGDQLTSLRNWLSKAREAIESSRMVAIRRCDSCYMTTAISLDPDESSPGLIPVAGQTILKTPYTKAMELWKVAGKCKCEKKIH